MPFDRKLFWQLFAIILPLKIALAAFFVTNSFVNDLPEDPRVFGIGYVEGDSRQYYDPADDFVAGAGYSSACRMPGILPIYAPLRTVFSIPESKVIIVFIQVLLDALTCILLAFTAGHWFGSRRAFWTTLVLYAISTFVSIRAIYLLSDSLCISFLILSIWFFTQWLIHQRMSFLLISGFFLTWSLFMRPVVLIVFPILAIFVLLHRGGVKALFVNIAVFFSSFVLAIFLWSSYTKSITGNRIFLQAPLEDCMHNFSPPYKAIRNLIITSGDDFQPWVESSAANWFFDYAAKPGDPFNWPQKRLTSVYNLDSIVILRNDYLKYRSLTAEDTSSADKLDSLSHAIVKRAEKYTLAYRTEHSFDYWVTNRLIFLRKFILPFRLDDLLLPRLENMTLIQKIAKAGSLLLLLFVNFTAILSVFYWLWKQNWNWVFWAAVPWSFALGLGLFGFIEQRYLAPAYPFLLATAAGFIASFLPSNWPFFKDKF